MVRDDTGLPPPVVIPPPKQTALRTRRRRRALIGVLVVVLLALAAVLGGKFLADHYLRHVPKVTGLSLSAATQRLEHAGYHVPDNKIVYTFSDTVPKDRVISTDPSAGDQLARGSDVTVTVSSGPHYYTLPSVRRMSYDAALAKLRGVGPLSISSAVKQEPSDTVPDGRVTRTDPAAGEKITADQTVTIYVSTGPPMVDVPNVSPGTPFGQAKKVLTGSAGSFEVRKVEEYSDTIDKGGVISLSPSDRATKFSTITVTVSKGPEYVTVPDIAFGTSEGDARTQLEQLGLVPDFQSPLGQRPDPVVYNVPDAGSKVRVGSTVTVLVF
jgi:serine/threonine-protein kinase